MADVDFVLLAEFARVEPTTGLITVVGGGYSRLAAENLPAQAVIYLVARLLAPPGEQMIEVRVTVGPSGEQPTFDMTAEATWPTSQEATDTGEPFAVPLVLAMPVPLQEAGPHTVVLTVEGGASKAVTFEVVGHATVRDD